MTRAVRLCLPARCRCRDLCLVQPVAFLANVHLSCFLLSYLVAFAGEIVQLLRERTTVTRSVLVFATVAGLIAHTAYLVSRSAQSGLPPLVGSSHDWLLVLAWLGILFYLIGLAVPDRVTLGVFLLPVVLALIIIAVFVEKAGDADEVREVAAHRWGMLHASSLVIGMVCVLAATISAVMYLLQHQRMRGRRIWLRTLELPNLERLTLVNRSLVIGTVVMLTVGLVTGFILAFKDPGATFEWTEPIIVGTLIVWALMVTALTWLLMQKDPTGRQVAQMTVLAGGFLLLTVFGLILVSGGVHGTNDSTADDDSTASRQSPVVQIAGLQNVQLLSRDVPSETAGAAVPQ